MIKEKPVEATVEQLLPDIPELTTADENQLEELEKHLKVAIEGKHCFTAIFHILVDTVDICKRTTDQHFLIEV